MRTSSARTDPDIGEVLAEVVAPAVRRLLRPGELQSVALSWTGAITAGPGATGMPTQLDAELVIMGERFVTSPWHLGQDAFSVDDALARFASDLQDFIAESRFGWGQLRPW